MKKYFLAILLTILTTFAFNSRASAVSNSWTTTVSSKSSVHWCDDLYSTQTLGFDGSFNPTYVLVELPDSVSTDAYFKIDFTNSTESGHNQNCWSDSYPQSVVQYLQRTDQTYSDYKKSFYLIVPTYNNQTRFFIRYQGASDITVKLTFTDSVDTPESAPCPDPLPPDRSAIMDDFHNVFLKVIVGVIPISAIIFVVWFMIDMLSSLIFGRGK